MYYSYTRCFISFCYKPFVLLFKQHYTIVPIFYDNIKNVFVITYNPHPREIYSNNVTYEYIIYDNLSTIYLYRATINIIQKKRSKCQTL